MNNEQLDRLETIISKDSYLYQLAQKDASNRLETSQNDNLETMQERADEFRKDDSMPEQDFLEGHIQVCSIDPDCEACQ